MEPTKAPLPTSSTFFLKPLHIFIGAVILVALSVLGTYFVFRSTLQNKKTTSQSPTTFPTPTINKDEAENMSTWKMFNLAPDYKFQYPAFLDDISQSQSSYFGAFHLSRKNTDEGWFSIESITDPKDKNGMPLTKVENQTLTTLKEVSPSFFTFLGYPAMKVVKNDSGGETRSVFVLKKNTLYILSNLQKTNDPIRLQTYERIVTTFKFLDENSQIQLPPSSAPSNKITTIPSDWLTYDKYYGNIGKAKFTLRYPPNYVADDTDPSSSNINFYEKGDPQYPGLINMNTWLNFFQTDEIQEYQSGSRRVWLQDALKKYYTSSADFSNLSFSDFATSNGKQYLIVSNWPDDREEKNTINYFGVQNGISFFINFSKKINKEDIERILYSLEVSK